MTLERYREIAAELLEIERKLRSYETDLYIDRSYEEGLCEATRETAQQALFDFRNHLCHRLGHGLAFTHVSDKEVDSNE